MVEGLKTAVVTGGTGGIGFETAVGLAEKGWRVIVTGRDAQRALDAAEQLVAAGAPEAIGLAADLSLQSEVARLAEEIAARAPTLDVLINNAGVLVGEERLTADGVELAIAVNHVAPWLLTNALLGPLEAAGAARVVIVSSSAHRFGQFRPGAIAPRRPYVGLSNYGDAKLLNLLTMFGWADDLSAHGVTVLAADPGGAATGMTDAMTARFMPWYMRPLWPLMKMMFGAQDPHESRRKAAVSTLVAATDPAFAGRTAVFIGPKGTETAPSRSASNLTNRADALAMTRATWMLSSPGPAGT